MSNDSGSVTSLVAGLTLVAANQPPVPKLFSFVSFLGQSFTLPLSDIVQLSKDPDHDPVSFISADPSSTNGMISGLNNVVLQGATLVYSPVEGYIGTDQFTYMITDQSDSPVGYVNALVLSPPVDRVVAPGGSASFSVGVSKVPTGYTFQWQLNGANIANATGVQLTINNAQLADAGSYRLVVTDSLGQTWPSPVAGLTVGTFGTGTGLTGDYYTDRTNGVGNFAGLPTLTRTDPNIDFNWATDPPDPSLTIDYFTVRWHGQIQPLYTDTYTFSTTSDDGSRLWVDGQLLVNQWQNQGAATRSGTIALQGQKKYDIVMEYYEWTSTSVARLSWSSLHQAPQIVPMTQLYPNSGMLQPRLAASLSPPNLVLNWAGTFSLESAPALTGPWSPVASSTISPYNVPTVGATQKFYRLVEPITP